MKLNDPFNRVSKRQNGVYDSLRKQWDAQGVVDRKVAIRIGHDMRKTALQLTAAVVAPGLILGWLFPEARGLLLMLGVLILLWMVSNYLLASMHLRRYINEELAEKTPGAPRSGNADEPPTDP